MSGIAASCGAIEEDDAAQMLGRLAHRAGTAEASVSVGGNWIGSRYSATRGPSQPISVDDGRLVLVADAEIYGAAIGEQAISLGEILNRDRGAEAFSDLDGTFAMVIAGEDGHLVAIRDRIGIKPLYWARKDEKVRFASEVRAFDPEWLPFVEFFPPGHVWDSVSGLARFAPDIRKESPSLAVESQSREYPESLLRQIREQLIKSVHRELMDDTSVVAFLSGGLDSSLIAAIANQWMEQRGTRLKTYAVGLEGSPDLMAARDVADYLGTDHTEYVYTAEDALAAVPDVVRALENFDPSLVRSSVANYILSERVCRDADVALTGEGADELFAGYRYLRRIDSAEGLDRELRTLIAGLHQGGLQRVDRTMMAHGLQARMPFLTNAMIELGMSIPASLKRADDTHPEKQLLREAFRGWLPDDILWRKKAQFGDGSGAVDALRKAIGDRVSESELEAQKDVVTPPLRTREELAYYLIFAETFPGARAERIIGRFATT